MENKKTKIISIVTSVFILLLLIGATYAYFIVGGNTGSSTSLDVTSSTLDTLSFQVGNPININVNQFNFGENAGNQSGTTKAIATISASNSPNTTKYSERYNIYFVIEANNFVYTTDDAKAEILLNVTDPNGNKVENITGLVNTGTGFDITTRTGGFLLVADYDIEANRAQTISQEWNVDVTFVNLETNQNKNAGKSLMGKLYLTKEKMSSYELTKISSIESTATYDSITANLNVSKGSANIAKYYFGIEKVSNDTTGYIQKNKAYVKSLAASDVKFIETDKSSYTFSNLDDNTTYKIYSYAIDKNKIKTNIYETEITTNEYNNPKVNSITHTSTLNSITISVSASKGDNEIVKYFFSRDNGATYEESTSNSYVFNNLNDTTEYKIKVKVQDSYGKYSAEYFEAITTETYILPSVTSVAPTTKYNQISVSVVGVKGTNNVAKYYYSIDSGTYVESETATYTFTGLNEKTTHTIKVKVADTQGRMSNEYGLSATTDAYVVPSITNVTTTSTSSSITINITGQNGDGTINKYYYSKDNGSNYIESTSNSYTFSDLTSNTTFYIKVYVKDSNGRVSSVSTASILTKITIADVCSNGTNLASCVKTFGNKGSDISSIYIHNSSLENGAGDNSYRYAGANPNNYVCFGSNESTCPTDNLYRIIGVFGDRVKLIKSDYANSNLLGTDGDYSTDTYSKSSSSTYKGELVTINQYSWNYKNNTSINDGYGSNTWSTSLLNKTNLNQNFITNIGAEWANKIDMTTWKVGGNTKSKIYYQPIKTVYQNEIVNPVTTNSTDNKTEYSAKIGLMYVSDYGFAAAPSAWTRTLQYFEQYGREDFKNVNWMYMGLDEWTLSRRADSAYIVFFVDGGGYVANLYVGNCTFAVRPSFNLESSITYVSGSGSASDPMVIN